MQDPWPCHEAGWHLKHVKPPICQSHEQGISTATHLDVTITLMEQHVAWPHFPAHAPQKITWSKRTLTDCIQTSLAKREQDWKIPLLALLAVAVRSVCHRVVTANRSHRLSQQTPECMASMKCIICSSSAHRILPDCTHMSALDLDRDMPFILHTTQ